MAGGLVTTMTRGRSPTVVGGASAKGQGIVFPSLLWEVLLAESPRQSVPKSRPEQAESFSMVPPQAPLAQRAPFADCLCGLHARCPGSAIGLQRYAPVPVLLATETRALGDCNDLFLK